MSNNRHLNSIYEVWTFELWRERERYSIWTMEKFLLGERTEAVEIGYYNRRTLSYIKLMIYVCFHSKLFGEWIYCLTIRKFKKLIPFYLNFIINQIIKLSIHQAKSVYRFVTALLDYKTNNINHYFITAKFDIKFTNVNYLRLLNLPWL